PGQQEGLFETDSEAPGPEDSGVSLERYDSAAGLESSDLDLAFDDPEREVGPTDLRQMREEIAKRVPPGSDMVTMGKLPQTPGAKKAIEDAIAEARDLGHDRVDAEHLLLGLLHRPEGAAAEMLRALGLKLEDVRREAQARFAQQGKAKGARRPQTGGMYERFTDRARKVLQLAHQEAQNLNHAYVGTE